MPAVTWALGLFVASCYYGITAVKSLFRKVQEYKHKRVDTHLDYDEALYSSRRYKLFEVERDENNVPIEGTEKKFSIFKASPKNVGMASVGLGIYFYHMKNILIVMAVLSLVSFYNVGKYYGSSGFVKEYTLTYPDGIGITRNVTCPRSYEVATPVTRSSVGSLCVDDQSSNPSYCHAVCTVPTVVYDHPEILEMFCNEHIPCSVRGTTACCNLALQPSHNDFPFVSVWLGILNVIIFSLWATYNRLSTNRLASYINQSVITAADYTMKVTGIPAEKCNVDTLTGFFSHYGEITWATPIPRIGKPLEKLKQLKALRDQLEEFDRHTTESLEEHFGTLSGLVYIFGAFGAMFLFACKSKGIEKAVEDRKQQIRESIETLTVEAASDQKEALGLIQSEKCTGEALISFNYEKFTKNAYNDHNKPVAKLLGVATCGIVRNHTQFHGRNIVVERAPEPSDIIWENTSVYGKEQTIRVAISTLVTALVLGLGAGIQLILEYVKRDVLDRYTTFKQDPLKDPLSQEGILLQVEVRGLSLMSSLGIIAVNGIIGSLELVLASFEKWHTWSEMERVLIFKLSVAFMLNTCVIPLLASSRKNWYVEGGFAEQIFYTQVISALIPPLVSILNPAALCTKLAYKHAQTQAILDTMLDPPEFSISSNYAEVFKGISMAVIFAPMLPVSPLIGLLGALMQCYTDRWFAFKKAKRPRQLSEQAIGMVYILFRMIPLLQLLMMMFCFPGVSWLVAIALGVWVILYTTGLLLTKRDVTGEDGGTGGLAFDEAKKVCDTGSLPPKQRKSYTENKLAESDEGNDDSGEAGKNAEEIRVSLPSLQPCTSGDGFALRYDG